MASVPFFYEVRREDMDMKDSFVDVLMRTRKLYNRAMEPVCRRFNLTLNEMSILVFLMNYPESDRAADFVERRGMSKSHVSLSVGNLERRGLLERHYHPDDRKSAHLSLTPAAVKLAKAGQEAQRSFQDQLFSGLSGAEREQCRIMLDWLSERLDSLES